MGNFMTLVRTKNPTTPLCEASPTNRLWVQVDLITLQHEAALFGPDGIAHRLGTDASEIFGRNPLGDSTFPGGKNGGSTGGGYIHGGGDFGLRW